MRFINNLINVFKKSKVGYALLEWLKDIDIIYIMLKKYQFHHESRKRLRVVTQEPYISNKFFNDNIQRVQRIISWLSDDLSKEVFQKMINVRCTDNYNDFPNPKLYNKYRKSYFWNNFMNYSQGEVYIDCGAFIGDSIVDFKKAMRHHKCEYRKIIAFEPDPDSHAKLRKKYPDITIFDAGVWNKDAKLNFNALNADGSALLNVFSTDLPDVSRVIKVSVKAIDDCHECKDATFIKMDVEGAELQALIGAEKTILKNKPKLAICIYHNDEDMLRIAEWIHERVPEYKLYVRHHAFLAIWDTVLYATI